MQSAILVAGVGSIAALFFGVAWFRHRHRPRPFSASQVWLLDNPILQRLSGTTSIVRRMQLQPGQRVLEIGPGPGRIAIPAARAVLPGGEFVGLDLQAEMLRRLEHRAVLARLSNVKTVQGDAAQPLTPDEYFDVVCICTALGEFPDRQGAIRQAFRTLRPGGTLSVTEMLPDPHYQSRATVRALAEAAGFRFRGSQGPWWFFTMNFEKPA